MLPYGRPTAIEMSFLATVVAFGCVAVFGFVAYGAFILVTTTPWETTLLIGSGVTIFAVTWYTFYLHMRDDFD